MLDGTAREQWDMIDIEVHSDSTHTDLQVGGVPHKMSFFQMARKSFLSDQTYST